MAIFAETHSEIAKQALKRENFIIQILQTEFDCGKLTSPNGNFLQNLSRITSFDSKLMKQIGTKSLQKDLFNKKSFLKKLQTKQKNVASKNQKLLN